MGRTHRRSSTKLNPTDLFSYTCMPCVKILETPKKKVMDIKKGGVTSGLMCVCAIVENAIIGYIGTSHPPFCTEANSFLFVQPRRPRLLMATSLVSWPAENSLHQSAATVKALPLPFHPRACIARSGRSARQGRGASASGKTPWHQPEMRR